MVAIDQQQPPRRWRSLAGARALATGAAPGAIHGEGLIQLVSFPQSTVLATPPCAAGGSSFPPRMQEQVVG